MVIFAVRVDTFVLETKPRTFYIGANDPEDFTRLRRVLLKECEHLPISAEYMHRDAFDLAAKYGKDTVAAIQCLGTQRLPLLFAAKNLLDALLHKRGLADRLAQKLAGLLPDHLPPRLREWRQRFDHHLILTVEDTAGDRTGELLTQAIAPGGASWFECTPSEAEKALLHRFSVAGAAVRYRHLHEGEVEDILSIDVALPRNTWQWFEQLPQPLGDKVRATIYYGHFLCHVFHQDYVVRRGIDVAALKRSILEILRARGAEYPAEHNVGHQYAASATLAAHYQALDPTNGLNPGIGLTSREKNWR